MKRLIILLCAAVYCIGIQAAPVDSLIAKRIANNFSQQKWEKSAINGEHSFQLVPNIGFENLYIFNSEQGDGFLIIAADDRSLPILGYSDHGSFVADSLPVNFSSWLANYEQEITWLKANVTTQDSIAALAWQEALTGCAPPSRNERSISPLIQTRWGQGSPYNTYCPYNSLLGTRCPTGCVATAMAQVMKYWEWPIQGNGSHSFDDWFYGTLSANFGNMYYGWWDMPNSVASNSDNTSIAVLMYHCGVSVDMNYGRNGSSAFTEDVPTALTRYFRYASSVRYVEKSDYTSSNWITLLKNELNNKRPIIYRGENSSSGHCFVCDGYDNNNYFHFNWGWDGQANGYFLLSSLTPSGHNYSSNQAAVIGVQPPDTHGGYNLMLKDYLSINKTFANCGETLTLTATITNRGSHTFANKLAVVAIDALDESNYYVLGSKSIQLRGGYYSTYTFNNLLIPPSGDYDLYVLYLNDQNTTYYAVADQSNYINYLSLTSICADPDSYEANNTLNNAYLLGSCTTSSKTFNINANFHTITDVDYYQINLPAGYNYTVEANIYSSTNSTNYTSDAHVRLKVNSGNWSSFYSSQIPSRTINNGGSIYFNVAPTTSGKRGTYQLHIYIRRSSSVGLDDDVDKENEIVIYPIPASDFCTLSWPQWTLGSRLQLMNISGQILIEQTISAETTYINLSSYADGLYFVRIIADDKVQTTQKIIHHN